MFSRRRDTAVTADEPALVEARNLRVSFARTDVLRDITLSVKAGEFVAIVGRSGAGKTTLLRTIAGLEPYEGELLVQGRVGFVFQGTSLLPWKRVLDNVRIAIRNGTRRERDDYAMKLLEALGIAALRGRYPAQLSGGEQQRVGVARALAVNPSLVLFDEPFASVDALTREDLQKWLRGLWQAKPRTALFVTHDLAEAVTLADRIVLLGYGRVVSEVTVDLPHPRQRSPAFEGIITSLRGALDAASAIPEDDVGTAK